MLIYVTAFAKEMKISRMIFANADNCKPNPLFIFGGGVANSWKQLTKYKISKIKNTLENPTSSTSTHCNNQYFILHVLR